MRRSALLYLATIVPGLLSGCTGTGVFFDHTATWFGANPNTPAGNSEMFQHLRGEDVAITPLVPEAGNIWPGPQKPDPTLQEIEQQNGGTLPNVVGGGTDHQQPRPTKPSVAPSVVEPGSVPNSLVGPEIQTPNGPSVDVTGGDQRVRGYRHLQSPPPNSTPAPSGKGVLVPNGNGTSTLIGPDGSVTTVPTNPH
jgi:hypothetical protein